MATLNDTDTFLGRKPLPRLAHRDTARDLEVRPTTSGSSRLGPGSAQVLDPQGPGSFVRGRQVPVREPALSKGAGVHGARSAALGTPRACEHRTTSPYPCFHWLLTV